MLFCIEALGSMKIKLVSYPVLFNVGGQTSKDCLLAWADGVKVADRRDQTRNPSLRKRCTDHCTMGRTSFKSKVRRWVPDENLWFPGQYFHTFQSWRPSWRSRVSLLSVLTTDVLLKEAGPGLIVPLTTIFNYCNRRNFRMRFNFVYFVLLAESTKFSSIRKPCPYTNVCDTAVAVRKLIAYESSRTLEYEIFTRTKISAITVYAFIGYSTRAARMESTIMETSHRFRGISGKTSN